MVKTLATLQIFLAFPLSVAAGSTYWQCIAKDSVSIQWSIDNNYHQVAVAKALEACKKESTDPKSCQVSAKECDYFVNGHSTKPLWQCTALDSQALAWKNTPKSDRDDAIIAAREYCQEQSQFQDSCYVNPVTCENLNRINP